MEKEKLIKLLIQELDGFKGYYDEELKSDFIDKYKNLSARDFFEETKIFIGFEVMIATKEMNSQLIQDLEILLNDGTIYRKSTEVGKVNQKGKWSLYKTIYYSRDARYHLIDTKEKIDYVIDMNQSCYSEEEIIENKGFYPHVLESLYDIDYVKSFHYETINFQKLTEYIENLKY